MNKPVVYQEDIDANLRYQFEQLVMREHTLAQELKECKAHRHKLLAACERAITFLEDPEPTIERSDSVWEQLKAALTKHPESDTM